MFLDIVREVTTEEKDSGNEVRFNCPFCGEENQKLYVQSEDPYLWHCKHCDRHGNPVQFVMSFYSVPFSEAKDILESYDYFMDDKDKTYLKENTDSSLTEAEQLFLLLANSNTSGDSKQDEILKPVPLPTGFKYLADNTKNRESFPFFNYLIARGITPELIFEYKIGYITQGKYFNPNKNAESTILNSVVFPTFDNDDNVIYWNTRSIIPDVTVKSLNAPVVDGYFSKKNTVYNLNNAEKTGRIIISEGVFNAITTGPSGVATFGKQITDEQIKLFRDAVDKNQNIEFLVFLDNDAKAQFINTAQRIYQFTDRVYLVINPYGNQDANDLGMETVRYLLQDAIPYKPNSAAELLLLTS